LVVVAYDVADDRRRVRLHTLLLGYGTPVQESVFECELTRAQDRAMRRRVGRVISGRTDKVRYYVLCEDCAGKVEDADGAVREGPPDVYFV
jgi:CRISPR-associated protein Cas2